MSKRTILTIIGLCLLIGCENREQSSKSQVVSSSTENDSELSELKNISSKEESKSTLSTAPEKIGFKPFYVFFNKGSRDNHYTPSGFMPNGNCISFEDVWTEDCHSPKTCIRIDYDLECSRLDQQWAGVYWLNPPNNWGQRKGGFNLTGAEKLTFWAKGQTGGEQIQEFTIGGVAGDFPDSDKVVIGPVILTPEWRQYTMDLRGKDLSYISGGFAWTTSEDVNFDSCTFYLDDIRFE